MRPQRGHAIFRFHSMMKHRLLLAMGALGYSCSHVFNTEKFDINKKDNVYDAAVILEYLYKKMLMLRP